MSLIRMPNALLPLDCLMTAACGLLYISFADSFGLMICFISSDRAPSITPAATLFAVFHSFNSSRYIFISSVVGWVAVGGGWDVPAALGSGDVVVAQLDGLVDL